MAINLYRKYEPLPLCRKEIALLERCQDKHVLDLGFMDTGWTEEKVKQGNLLHFMIRRVAASLTGIDIDPSLRHLLPEESANYKVFFGNVEDPETYAPVSDMTFDVVVAAELLEHLNNPGMFLQSVRTVMRERTILLVTVPNCLRHTNYANALKGVEMVHPDHNYWFSPTTIQTLLNRNGYHIKDMKSYVYGNERPEAIGLSRLACMGLVVEASSAREGETPQSWRGCASFAPTQ
jgi:SAM-dependent methyltransferase